VGLIVESSAIPAWQVDVVLDLLAADFVDLRFMLQASAVTQAERPDHSETRYGQDRSGAPRSLGYSLFEALDRRRTRIAADAWAMVALETIPGMPILEAMSDRADGGGFGDLQGAGIDVIVDLSRGAVGAPYASIASAGVWYLRPGGIASVDGASLDAWDVMSDRTVTETSLLRIGPRGGPPMVLARGWFPTDHGSVIRNRQQPAFGAVHFVIEALNRLHAGRTNEGGESVRSITARSTPDTPAWADPPPGRGPSSLDVVRWLGPKAIRSVEARARRLAHADADVEQWQVAIRAGSDRSLPEAPTDMTGFAFIKAPAGHFYADPFLFSHRDATYLFFEDYDYSIGRAVISCASVSSDGTVGPPEVVLTAAHHLSYPYLVSRGDEVYMIPEAAGSGGVQLYRADPFPSTWTHVRTLYEGAYPVDTSVWYDGERWWFFTTLREPRSKAQCMFLFHSSDLTGPWQVHPQSPISVDVRRSRGAGRIFTHEGRLIRPSQDGSRAYGSSWSLNEIEVLTDSAFREHEIAIVTADWAPGLTGTHTYTRSAGLEATDAKVLVPFRTTRPGS
jgi:hypothetical protein